VARAEQSRDVVGAYVAQLQPDLFGRRRMRRRITEEIRGHLEDAVARHVDEGMSIHDAQVRAVERFGAPQTVIASWAESKGIGVVTNFTRYGGIAGIVGAVGLTTSFMWAEASWAFSSGWFAETALAFGALLAAGMVALYVRLRGKLGRFGRIGFKLIIAGLVVGFASGMLWFLPGSVVGLVSLISGAGMYLAGAVRADVVPRGALYLWCAGFIGATAIGFGGSIANGETGYVAMAVGYGLFDAGWVWIGVHLFREHPDAEEHHTPAVA
jgi:hypothetical protein